MMPLTTHFLASCVLLLTAVGGRCTNMTVLAQNDGIQNFHSLNTTEGKLHTSPTEEYPTSSQDPELCQILKLCFSHPNRLLLNASQSLESWRQFTTKADHFVTKSKAQISSRSSQHDDQSASNAILQREMFPAFKSGDVQSPAQQWRSSRSSPALYTPTSSVPNVSKMDQYTNALPTQREIVSWEMLTATTPIKETEYLHCQEMETFFNTLQLCESRDSGDPSRSCKSRCGQGQSFDHSFDNCSCDDKCIIYNDCCIDFYIHCNHTFNQIVQLYGEKIFSYRSRAHESGAAAIYSCSDKEDTERHLTSPTPTATTAFISTSTGLLHWGGLAELTIAHNLVADLSSGLIYQDVHAYYFCNPKSSPDPYIISLVLPIKSQYINDQSIESHVFPAHSIEHNPYILDPFPTMRGSFHEETVKCGSCAIQSVNYFCGAKIRKEMSIVEDYQVRVNSSGPLYQTGNCSHWPSLRGGMKNWMALKRVLGVSLPPNYLKPTPSSTDLRQAIMDAQSQDMLGTVTIRRRLYDTKLDLEFTGAPWARMRCADFYQLLDACEILQCSPGYLTTETGKCWVYNSILMTAEAIDANITATNKSVIRSFVPFCQCLSFYKVFKAFQIFDMVRLFLTKEECRLNVRGGDEGQQASFRDGDYIHDKESDFRDWLDRANIQDSVYYVDDKRKSENTSNNLEKLVDYKHALLKGLVEYRHDCNENFENLTICFVGDVRNSDLRCFSFTYDEIYAVSQDGATSAQHPTPYVSSGAVHNNQCHRKLQLQILVILVVVFCIMSSLASGHTR